ncbi:hypothetical protein AAHA92_11800 [Salvia divinorum]|uniref:Uncharacterized protein n=1 Tax=Salvia divinorum TaxID=28513 RepID=A0ABD1HI69_SALDI
MKCSFLSTAFIESLSLNLHIIIHDIAINSPLHDSTISSNLTHDLILPFSGNHLIAGIPSTSSPPATSVIASVRRRPSKCHKKATTIPNSTLPTRAKSSAIAD